LSPNIINSLVFSDANGFDGNISLVGSVATLTITTALTQGSVPFIGTSGALTQDNANLFFDDTNNRLGINTNAPTTALDVFGSGIIGRLNGTSTNNAFLGFANAGTNRWSIGNVQSDHRFRIFSETNTSELVTVLQTGEFGIGIANPTTKFHIDGAATALIANLDANVSVAKSISFRSDNSNRINLEVSGTESGSNAGANFFLRTYTDLGALIETPFSIVRSTGVTTIKSLTLTNALSVANGGTGATSFTSGSILFSNGTSVAQDNAKFFWDDTNNRLGIGTSSPTRILHLSDSGSNCAIRIDNTVSGRPFLLTYDDSQNATFINSSDSGIIAFNTGTGTSTTKLSIAASGAATFKVNTDRNLAIKYDTNITLSAQGDSGGPESLRVYADTFRLYTATTAVGLTERFTISNTGTATFLNTLNINTDSDIIRFGNLLRWGFQRPAADNRFVSFYRTLHTTGTPVWTVDGDNGNVGIGISTPARKLDVFADAIKLGDGGSFFFEMNVGASSSFFTNFSMGGVDVLRLRGDGLISAIGIYNNTYSNAANVYIGSDGFIGRSTSSLKYKTDVVNYNKGLEDVMKLRAVSYKSKNPNEQGLTFAGLIAEEVHDLGLTEFVQYANDGSPDALSYSNMVALLIKSIQEQQAQIEELKTLINK
jgi:hypothetical protein